MSLKKLEKRERKMLEKRKMKEMAGLPTICPVPGVPGAWLKHHITTKHSTCPHCRMQFLGGRNSQLKLHIATAH
jgi:hypothetical protein